MPCHSPGIPAASAKPRVLPTVWQDKWEETRSGASALAVSKLRRYRNNAHLRFVAGKPCLICGRRPSDPHHLRFMQPRAMGRKVSDEYVVPLCRTHHRTNHRAGNERVWWQQLGIDPVQIARDLWKETRGVRFAAAPSAPVAESTAEQTASALHPATMDTASTPSPALTPFRSSVMSCG